MNKFNKNNISDKYLVNIPSNIIIFIENNTESFNIIINIMEFLENYHKMDYENILADIENENITVIDRLDLVHIYIKQNIDVVGKNLGIIFNDDISNITKASILYSILEEIPHDKDRIESYVRIIENDDISDYDKLVDILSINNDVTHTTITDAVYMLEPYIITNIQELINNTVKTSDLENNDGKITRTKFRDFKKKICSRETIGETLCISGVNPLIELKDVIILTNVDINKLLSVSPDEAIYDIVSLILLFSIDADMDDETITSNINYINNNIEDELIQDKVMNKITLIINELGNK